MPTTAVLFTAMLVWFACTVEASVSDNEAKHILGGAMLTAVGMRTASLFTDRAEHSWEYLPDGSVRFQYGITETPQGFTVKCGLGVAFTAGVAIATGQKGKDWDNVMMGAGLWTIGELAQRVLKVYVFK